VAGSIRPRVCKNPKLRRACEDFSHATAALVPAMTSALHFNCALDKLGDTLSHHRRTPAGFYTLWTLTQHSTMEKLMFNVRLQMDLVY